MGVYYGQGLMLAHTRSDERDDDLNAVNKLINQRLGDDFVHQPDPVWNFQPDSPEWRILRSTLLHAAQIHTIGELLTQQKAVDAGQLEESIGNWLNTR